MIMVTLMELMTMRLESLLLQRKYFVFLCTEACRSFFLSEEEEKEEEEEEEEEEEPKEDKGNIAATSIPTTTTTTTVSTPPRPISGRKGGEEDNNNNSSFLQIGSPQRLRVAAFGQVAKSPSNLGFLARKVSQRWRRRHVSESKSTRKFKQ